MTYGIAFTALADPTRRSLFERLHRQPQTVGELAEWAQIRQPTVSQHLRVLREAQLVTDRRDGTCRIYSTERAGLAALRKYLEAFWDDALAAYAADDTKQKTRTGRKKTPGKTRRAR